MTSDRSLVPLARPLPVQRRPLPLVAVERFLPAATRTLAAAVAAFAAEYALRALANRALSPVVEPRRVTAAPSSVTRVIVTEFVVIERTRRI
jgi:hypothetical protein